MKQYLSYIIGMLGLVSFACSGCEETDSLTTVSGFQVTLIEAGTEEARSTPSEIGKPAASQFQLKIVNTVTQKTVYDDTYKSGFIAAGQGVYTVTATCGTDAVLAVDAPYYKGEMTEVEVPEKSSAPVEVSIPCRVANALASVFVKEGDEQKFAELYSEYKVEVAVGTSVTSLSPVDGRSAYYKAGTIPTFTFRGTLKSNGQQVSKTLEGGALADAANFAAGQHVKITLGYQPTQPGWMPTIEKVAVETVTVSQSLPMEWLPAPKISSTGFDATNTLDVYETETGKSATIDLAVASPLQDVEFTLNFQDEVLATAAINKTYQLSQMTSSEIASLKNIGISLPVVGEKYPSIGLTANLLDDLLAQNGITVKNQITIHSVKANNRTQKDNAPVTFTIATHQPEFSVAVLPGNIWTKEFTVEECAVAPGKGNLTKMKEKGLLYQYSLDGQNWTDLPADLTQTGLTPNCSYYVQCVYRNKFYSNKVSFSTNPIVNLTNGGMEEWQYSNGPQASWPDQGPFWKRWYVRNVKDETTEGWCTLNELTTSNNDPKAYISNSGTERSETSHSGSYAAEIKTIGWGSGTTAASPLSTIKKNTPGELFLGKVVELNPIYGITFSSRPTRLLFYYKYLPEGNHQFLVEVSLANGEDIIASNVFYGDASDDYVEKYVDFNYDPEKVNLDVMTLHIRFTSGENTNAEVDKASISRGSRHVGNKLYIDDISLIYDK